MLKVKESLTLAGSTKYLAIGWPEIQEYMDHPDYPEECYFDPRKDTWFIPESWIMWHDNYEYEKAEELSGDIEDLEDAMG